MSMEHSRKRGSWGPTRTKQSSEPECNINNIVKRFTKTGELTHISTALGEYRDMSGTPDLHTAMNIVADAQSIFMELPPEIRFKCDNDVAKFLNFFDDKANTNELVDYGVLPESERIPEPETPPETPAPESEVQGGE